MSRPRTALLVTLGLVGVVVVGTALAFWIGSDAAPSRPAAESRATPRDSGPAATTNPAPAARVTAPSWTLPDLDGQARRLEDFRGQIVLLNFWATWCPPCLEEIPDLIKLHEAYRDRGVAVVGVSMDTSARPVRAFMDRMSIAYPVVMGEMEVAIRYRVAGIPASFLLDREGRVVKRWSGPYPLRSFAQRIDALLAEEGAP